mmetsp:Transcript_24193/g.84004  ORF Transcript_24193/g.84004 Transcript_24193/m.84004 type:complete len:331 (-) Transcript_24193:971-1963(-)
MHHAVSAARRHQRAGARREAHGHDLGVVRGQHVRQAHGTQVVDAHVALTVADGEAAAGWVRAQAPQPNPHVRQRRHLGVDRLHHHALHRPRPGRAHRRQVARVGRGRRVRELAGRRAAVARVRVHDVQQLPRVEGVEVAPGRRHVVDAQLARLGLRAGGRRGAVRLGRPRLAQSHLVQVPESDRRVRGARDKGALRQRRPATAVGRRRLGQHRHVPDRRRVVDEGAVLGHAVDALDVPHEQRAVAVDGHQLRRVGRQPQAQRRRPHAALASRPGRVRGARHRRRRGAAHRRRLRQRGEEVERGGLERAHDAVRAADVDDGLRDGDAERCR